MKLVYLLIFLLLVTACSTNKNNMGQNNSCREGRTHVNGICVSYEVADYISCVRARGGELESSENNSFEFDIKYLIDVGTSLEASTKWKERYPDSKENIRAIIDECGKISARKNKKLPKISVNNFVSPNQLWNVSVGRYTSVFNINVKKNGHFEGMSHWGMLSGEDVNDPIDGNINGDRVIFTRHLSHSRHIGKIQTWKGTIIPNINTISGSWSGTGGSGSWTAKITNK